MGSLVGAGMLVLGLILAFGGLAVLLSRDEYLAVRADGVLFHNASSDAVHLWSDIAKISPDEVGDAWSICLTDATTHQVTAPYAGTAPRELALHLEQLRMKARLGPLEAVEVARLAIGQPHKRP
jgi:hypothetical protein